MTRTHPRTGEMRVVSVTDNGTRLSISTTCGTLRCSAARGREEADRKGLEGLTEGETAVIGESTVRDDPGPGQADPVVELKSRFLLYVARHPGPITARRVYDLYITRFGAG